MWMFLTMRCERLLLLELAKFAKPNFIFFPHSCLNSSTSSKKTKVQTKSLKIGSLTKQFSPFHFLSEFSLRKEKIFEVIFTFSSFLLTKDGCCCSQLFLPTTLAEPQIVLPCRISKWIRTKEKEYFF